VEVLAVTKPGIAIMSINNVVLPFEKDIFPNSISLEDALYSFKPATSIPPEVTSPHGPKRQRRDPAVIDSLHSTIDNFRFLSLSHFLDVV
jgi:hypothetical protein